MDKKKKFYLVMAILAIAFAVVFGVVTTIVLNNRKAALDDLNNKNDQIEDVIS